jgi:hypothetical protein
MNENILELFKKRLTHLIKNKPKNTDEELMTILCEIDDMKNKLDYDAINVNLYLLKREVKYTTN